MNQYSEDIKTENISKSKKKEMEDSLKDFNIDKDDVDIDKDIIYEVKIPKNSSDIMLKISRMIKTSVLTISGYEEQPTSDNSSTKYKLTKPPLSSSVVIKSFTALLESYADESNLLTKKTWDDFKIQAKADWGAFYKLCLREKSSPEEHLRTVQRIFQGGLINIGEITCDNPQNMRTLFGTINDKKEEDDGRSVF